MLTGLEEKTGVKVPLRSGAKRDEDEEDSVAGALFADDVVGLAPSLEHAQQLCEHITAWTQVHEMKVGIKKCGIMEIQPPSTEEVELHEDHELRDGLRLDGELLPIVTEYKYLGLWLTKDLDPVKFVTKRTEAGRATVNTLLPFLGCGTIPLSMRLQVVRAVIMPRLLYGAEVYGNNRQELTSKVQTLLNKCLKTMMGKLGGPTLTVPSVPLWKEFGIDPFCAIANGRRARAYQKCQSLKTTVGSLVQTRSG